MIWSFSGAIEIPVFALHQSRIRLGAISPVERYQRRQRARVSRHEDRALSKRPAPACRAIEIPIAAFDNARLRDTAEPAQTNQRHELARRSESKNCARSP